MATTEEVVFEQMRCVDWLRTVTVYTKQTTGCPRWDWGALPSRLASDTLILPYSFSLSFQPANRQSQRCMQLLSVALTLDGDWTGLDWTGRCHACVPPMG